MDETGPHRLRCLLGLEAAVPLLPALAVGCLVADRPPRTRASTSDRSCRCGHVCGCAPASVIAPHAIETRVSNKLSHGVTSSVGVVQAPGCSSTAGAAFNSVDCMGEVGQDSGTSLYLDKLPVSSWQDLVEAMPDKEFQNVTRSTLPLVAYWIEQGLRRGQAYHFEYTVPSVARARPSHTDLMIVASHSAEAIEGKSTEPRYETVGEWSAKPGALRQSALGHWLKIIRGVTKVEPASGDVDNCVYQMVHRLASVCSIERSRRRLTYQIFRVGDSHDWYPR